MIERWTSYAITKLLGKTIVAVRYLNSKEINTLGWSRRALVIQLSDGTILYPSADDEGNDAGALFGQAKDGTDCTFPVI
jgi:hypothetical protein